MAGLCHADALVKKNQLRTDCDEATYTVSDVAELRQAAQTTPVVGRSQCSWELNINRTVSSSQLTDSLDYWLCALLSPFINSVTRCFGKRCEHQTYMQTDLASSGSAQVQLDFLVPLPPKTNITLCNNHRQSLDSMDNPNTTGIQTTQEAIRLSVRVYNHQHFWHHTHKILTSASARCICAICGVQ